MRLNEKLPSFNLLGTDNIQHNIQDYQDKEAVVIIFTCNHCPYARAYISRINDLVSDYEKRNVGFYAISANDAKQYPEDAFINMVPMAQELNLEGKYLYDESQEIATKFNAKRTPEVFVFDREKKLVYQGAIDDNYQSEYLVKESYLKDALESLLNNRPLNLQETNPIGCTIKWKAA